MTPMQILDKKYGHALLVMFDLFKDGRQREISLQERICFLQNEIDLIKSGGTKK